MTVNYRKIGVSFAATLLIAPFFALAADTGDIIITEIAYDLKGADDGREWVEIKNTTMAEIDLTGWKFNDGSNHILNAPPKNGGQGTLTIPAGGYAVLADDAVVFLSDHPGFSGTVIDTVMSLNNTAATLAILDKDGATVDSVAHQKEWGANGNGMTLEKNGTWKESAQEGGTPGADNSVSLTINQNATSTDSELLSQSFSLVSGTRSLTADAGGNVLALAGAEVFFDGSKSSGGNLIYRWNFGDGATSEGKSVLHSFMFPGSYIVTLTVSDGLNSDSDQIKTDIYPSGVGLSEFLPIAGDGETNWVELRNKSPYDADLSLWSIGQKENGDGAFKIPPGTFIAGGGFLVFSSDVLKFSFPGKDGRLYLFYPNSQVADAVEYKNARGGWAAALSPVGRFVWTDRKTPGAPNIVVSADVPESATSISPVLPLEEREPAAGKTETKFVGYLKRQGIKSFIAEPALAYVDDSQSVLKRQAANEAPSGMALAFGAFGWSYFVGILALFILGAMIYLRFSK